VEGDAVDQVIRFGEELRASPPRWARDILVHTPAPRVVKPLFQAITRGAGSFHGSQCLRNRTGVQSD
jgi:hypothetical protein